MTDFVKHLRCLLLDMDGTVYRGSVPIGDMAGTLAAIRRHGIRLCYFTNNSSKTPEDYVKKLTALGLYDPADRVYTSAIATIAYLKEHHAGARVLLLATPTVRQSFLDAGITLVDTSDADIVLLAYDTTLTFEKLRVANEALVKGATYIATHPDFVCPTEDISMPDVGSFIKLLEASSGRVPDAVIGKPNALAAEAILAGLGIPPQEAAMVGDRLYTDIRFGLNAGMNAILVLSGESTMDTLQKSDVKPTLVLPDLHALLPLLDE